MIGPLLILAASMVSGADTPASVLAQQVFPPETSLIFVARVLEAGPSRWRVTDSGLAKRTVRTRLEVQRVLMSGLAAKPAVGVVVSEVQQSQWQSGVIWETPDFWSDRELQAGDEYLVIGGPESRGLAEAFASPLAVWPVSMDPNLVQDVEFILSGSTLGVKEQASRILDLLKRDSRQHSLFLARYIAALGIAAEGADRRNLLDWIGRVGGDRLSEPGRAELLRSFHRQLLTLSASPDDALEALAAASIRTLADVSTGNLGAITPRIDSVIVVYLPWLAKVRPDSRYLGRRTPPEQRTKAAEAMRWLASLDRFPEKSRQVLRDLASALTK